MTWRRICDDVGIAGLHGVVNFGFDDSFAGNFIQIRLNVGVTDGAVDTIERIGLQTNRRLRKRTVDAGVLSRRLPVVIAYCWHSKDAGISDYARLQWHRCLGESSLPPLFIYDVGRRTIVHRGFHVSRLFCYLHSLASLSRPFCHRRTLPVSGVSGSLHLFHLNHPCCRSDSWSIHRWISLGGPLSVSLLFHLSDLSSFGLMFPFCGLLSVRFLFPFRFPLSVRLLYRLCDFLSVRSLFPFCGQWSVRPLFPFCG